MSNRRARQRALYAERNAERIRNRMSEQMHDMVERHRREIRRIYADAAKEYHQRHLSMEAQMEHLMKQIVTIKKCEPLIVGGAGILDTPQIT